MMQNGGKYNDIGHYHLHIFPRFDDDEFGWCCAERQWEYNQDIADKIRQNIYIW